MRGHAEMDRQLDAAEREGRCLHPTSESVRKALLRRVKTGDIVSPRPGLFIRSALWRSLDAIDQVKHVVRGLAHWHPDWVFGGVAAACMHDLWVDFSTARKALHARMLVVCATRGTYHNSRHIERKHHIHMNYIVIDGVRVTTLAQTAADCCAIMTFLDGKPIADSVMRKGVRAETIMECAAVNGMVKQICVKHSNMRILMRRTVGSPEWAPRSSNVGSCYRSSRWNSSIHSRGGGSASIICGKPRMVDSSSLNSMGS